MTAMLQGKAAVVRDKAQPLAIEDVTFEPPRHDEVLVCIGGTGVCHTDMFVRDQGYAVPLPLLRCRDSVPQVFIPQLIKLWRAGRFPFDRLVRFFDLADIDQAIADSESGCVLKPIVRPAAGESA